MKCPKCSRDQKAKAGMSCGGCGYRFTFNPKQRGSLGLTDGKFVGIIKATSQNDTKWFTENQLYATFCKRMSGSVWPAVLAGLAVLAVSIYAMIADGAPVAFFVFFVGTVVVVIKFWRVFAPVQYTGHSRFQELLGRWKSAGKKIERMIEKPSLHEPPPEWKEPDIYDYGVERILIVERDILVDLFVRNGVHAEQRMLVIAESGYPEYLLPVARRLLDERPDLPVFLLHDATTDGEMMEERVLTGNLLPIGEHPLTDLGMFPKDFRKLKRTKHFDPENTSRALPVDAMAMSFLAAGLGAALISGVAMSAMIEEQAGGSIHEGGFDFG